MYINRIQIKNYRGLDINVCDIKNKILIIGKNDSGKTTLCSAIRKVLDYKLRRNPLTENDSTNFNKENIEIELDINLDDISKTNKNRLGKLIDIDEQNRYYLRIKFVATFNYNIMQYEEELQVGAEDITTYPASKFTDIDRAIDVIYFDPILKIDNQKKEFFDYEQKESDKKDQDIMEEVKKSVNNLNVQIQSNPTISELATFINSQDGFDKIFADVEFKIKSNIDVSNIYKSLDIYPYVKGTNKQTNIGDGKVKALSMILQRLTRQSDKQKIFIFEEPENHLYPLLQQHYASLTSLLGIDQIIFTSHSPYIVDFEKMNQIIKLIVANEEGKRIVNYKTLNISSDDYSNFGYIQNSELAEMMFYDKVLLIEGYSEKYFYDLLRIKDANFREYLVSNNMGIFSVYGVNFGPAKKFFENLGIEVWIKTDNDVFKVPGKEKMRYAGIERCLDCLNAEGRNKLSKLLNNSLDKEQFTFNIGEEDTNNIHKNMDKIVDLFYENGVLLSKHSEGFERDFLEYVNRIDTMKEDMEYLKNAKLKNLHKFIIENQIDIRIDKNDKNNILVRFINGRVEP